MEDQAESAAAMEMPRTVRIAVNMYWVTVLISLPVMIFIVPQTLQATQEHLPAGGDFTTIGAIVMIFAVISLVVYAYLISKLSSGKNWARILLLLFFLSGVHSSYDYLVHPVMSVPWMWLAPGFIMNLMQGVAVVLLFLPASRVWFRKRVVS